MSLIDREALYEKACDLEAQALSYVGKIVNDKTRTEEWRIWSVVLAERTAFKHDVFDAPEAQPEQPPYVAEIEAEYQKAVKMPHIHKPLAKALYEVWKKHDREDAERRTDDSISD